MSNLFGPRKSSDATKSDPLGDAEFLPVVIAASVALIVILIVAIAVVGGTGKDLVPQNRTLHPVSQIVMPQTTNGA